jgi:hypothetical protein
MCCAKVYTLANLSEEVEVLEPTELLKKVVKTAKALINVYVKK